MTSFVCLTAGEWRNLCSIGRIRIHESRAKQRQDQLDKSFFDTIFSLSLERFSLGETSDLLITEFKFLENKAYGFSPPGAENGVKWLLLEQVIRFLPIRGDDSWVFEADALKASIALTAAEFEPQWNDWLKEKMIEQSCMNGLSLLQAVGLKSEPIENEKKISEWRELAARAIAPSLAGIDESDYATHFLKNSEKIFHMVREDADKGAIFVSCPIEWINFRLSSDVMLTNTDLAEHAQRLHEKYSNAPFEPKLVNTEELAIFSAYLQATYPDVFPGSWTPALVTLYVQYSHRVKFGSVSPEDILAAVQALSIKEPETPLNLFVFLIGIALGPNKTHSLERLLNPHRFTTTTPPQLQPAFQVTSSDSATPHLSQMSAAFPNAT
jgi:hypothetical protein